jgi:hypothetical protein
VVTVHCDETGKLDKTWNEINDVFFGGAKAVYVDASAAEIGGRALPVVSILNNNPYTIEAELGDNDWTYLRFATEDPDDYPALED